MCAMMPQLRMRARASDALRGPPLAARAPATRPALPFHAATPRVAILPIMDDMWNPPPDSLWLVRGALLV